jgi:hypothetical protein
MRGMASMVHTLVPLGDTMKETAADDKARDAIKRDCAGPIKIYKHNDRGTKGMPDMSVTWAWCTSWLEFKMLKGEENIHSELDPLQLVELVRLERAGGRAWVIAYRKATKTMGEYLTIYQPTTLLNNQQPVAREWSSHANVLRDLRTFGVAKFQGFNHGAVVALIKATHGTY